MIAGAQKEIHGLSAADNDGRGSTHASEMSAAESQNTIRLWIFNLVQYFRRFINSRIGLPTLLGAIDW